MPTEIYARFIVSGNVYFSQGTALLRESRALRESGDLHGALMQHKYGCDSLALAHSNYVRGIHAADDRVHRRVELIRRVVLVNIHSLTPLPFPDGKRADAHAFLQRELLTRGRLAVRRSQVTAGAAQQFSEDEMKRAISDTKNDSTSTVRAEVDGVRSAAAWTWRRFCRDGAHPIAGWRASELLSALPGLLAGQRAVLSGVLSMAV